MFILEMLKFNILAAAVILITLLVSHLLKNKYSVRWKYWTWLILSVLLLLPFHFTALQPLFKVTVPQETVAPMAVPTVAPMAVPTAVPGKREASLVLFAVPRRANRKM